MRPMPDDSYPTATSELQASTERIFASHTPAQAAEGKSELQKNQHVQFLARALIQGFPTKYMSQDASQPWLIFWTLQGLSVLEVALDPGNKQRCVCGETLRSAVSELGLGSEL